MLKISVLACTGITFGLLVSATVKEIKTLHAQLPTPVKLVVVDKAVDPRIVKMLTVLTLLDCPPVKQHKVSEAIVEASDKINVDPTLIAVLMKTESGFDLKAESNKGYKGLMQTPYASKQWADVDVLIGARILEEKLKLTSGDMELALALYKGGNNPLAKRQAAQVLTLYKEVRNELRSSGRG